MLAQLMNEPMVTFHIGTLVDVWDWIGVNIIWNKPNKPFYDFDT